MKKILYILLFALLQNFAWAARAYPGLIKVTQPDGTQLNIRLYGDEFFSYAATVDNKLIAQKKDGYYYYATFDGEAVVATRTRVGDPLTKAIGVVSASDIALKAADIALKKRALQPVTKGYDLSKVTLTKSNPQVSSLVLLVQYSDVKFVTPNTQEAFSRMLNEKGYSDNGGTGSARDYFYDNLMGAIDFEFVVSSVLTLSKTMSYYGENSGSNKWSNIQELVKEACALAKSAGVDFSRFDSNGDGVVDNVFIYFAGYDEAQGGSSGAIWSHKGQVVDNVTYDGKRLGAYACSSELRGNSGSTMSGIGTFCHEFGHVLGLPDFYDTNAGANGEHEGLYNLALMSSGNYNNSGRTPPYMTVIEREMLGILTPEKIETKGDYSLATIDRNKGFRIESGNKDEYFLIENRRNVGWDKYIGGKGMLVYHIDRSNNAVGGTVAGTLWRTNSINNYVAHPCAYYVASTTINNSIGNIFYPGLASLTSLELIAWSGRIIPQSINSITFSGENVDFKVNLPASNNLTGRVFGATGSAVGGARIVIAEVESQTKSGSGGGIRSIPAMVQTKAVGQIVVTADDNGKFAVDDLKKGSYQFVAFKDGYVNSSGMFTVDTGNNVLQIIMLTAAQNNDKKMSWSTNRIRTAVGLVGDLYASHYWGASDLGEYAGGKIDGVYFHPYASGKLMTLYVYVNDAVVFTRELGSSYSVGNINFIDLGGENLTVPTDKSLRVAIKAVGVVKDEYPFAIDDGESVVNRGDAYSTDGKRWSSLKVDSKLEGNFIIGLNVKVVGVLDRIKVAAQQRDAYFDIAALNPESKPVVINVEKLGGGKKRYDIGAARWFVIGDLESDCVYNYTLEIEGKTPVASQFATTKVVSQYAALYEAKARYALGDVLPLIMLNIPDGVSSLKWFVNGALTTKRIVNLTENCTIKVEITFESGDTETIVRRIKLN